ncbi:MAG: tripartite tricarboxylate transporter substrate binding protein [Bacteroidota bacterium]
MRTLVRALVLALAAALPGAALSQAFPAKPVRLVVPFPPGGATDIIARLLGQKLQEIWGQATVIEYKPGGGTVVGTDYVAKSPPDGYTMGIVITAHVINPGLRSDLPYDTIKDLSGVSMVAVQHIALVATPGLEANTVPELIALAKKNPGRLTYATPGTGTAMHLAGELLKSQAGIDIVHVPYKGGAPAYPDVIAGRVALQIDPMSASMPNIKAGKVKLLAITSPQRAPTVPEVPTVAETLPGFSVMSISGVVVPSATPREVVRKASADINRALAASDLVERMAQQGMEPSGNTPEQFDAFIRAEIEKWSKVVKSSGAKLD